MVPMCMYVFFYFNIHGNFHVSVMLSVSESVISKFSYIHEKGQQKTMAMLTAGDTTECLESQYITGRSINCYSQLGK